MAQTRCKRKKSEKDLLLTLHRWTVKLRHHRPDDEGHDAHGQEYGQLGEDPGCHVFDRREPAPEQRSQEGNRVGQSRMESGGEDRGNHLEGPETEDQVGHLDRLLPGAVGRRVHDRLESELVEFWEPLEDGLVKVLDDHLQGGLGPPGLDDQSLGLRNPRRLLGIGPSLALGSSKRRGPGTAPSFPAVFVDQVIVVFG